VLEQHNRRRQLCFRGLHSACGLKRRLPLLLILILLIVPVDAAVVWLCSTASAPIANFATCAWHLYIHVAKAKRRL
jgi:hypothetical protein